MKKEITIEDLKKMNKDELIDELVKRIVSYDKLRDEEWYFEDEKGNREMWSDEDIDEHDELLEDIDNAKQDLVDCIRVLKKDPKFCW